MISITCCFLMALKWFLRAVLPEKNDFFGQKSFHFVLWSLPALKTMILLIGRTTVDIDELIGACSSSNTALVLSYSFYILVSLVMLAVGFFKLVAMKKQHQTNSLAQSGVIILICLLTYSIELACELYVYFEAKYWTHLPIKFELNETDSFPSLDNKSWPNLPVFLLRISLKFANSLAILFVSIFMRLKLNDEKRMVLSTLRKPIDLKLTSAPYSSTTPNVMRARKCDCKRLCVGSNSKSSQYSSDITHNELFSSTATTPSDLHYCMPNALLDDQHAKKSNVSTFIKFNQSFGKSGSLKSQVNYF